MIELLVSKDFQLLNTVRSELEQAIQESGVHEHIHVQVIETYGQARKEKFIGSPTIKIDGNDIDPENTLFFSETKQRMYFFKGKHYHYPPKEMIKQALHNLKKPHAKKASITLTA